MAEHLDPEVVGRRKKSLADLDDHLARTFRESFLGESARVLVESRPGVTGEGLTGLTDRFVRVDFDGPDSLHGSIVDVALEHLEGDRVRGRLGVADSAELDLPGSTRL